MKILEFSYPTALNILEAKIEVADKKLQTANKERIGAVILGFVPFKDGDNRWWLCLAPPSLMEVMVTEG